MNIGKCRSCGASLIWCETATGKKMPIDAESSEDGNVQLRQRIEELERTLME